MLSDDFLDHVADFYGDFTVDQLAERLGLTTTELMEELEPLIDDNLFDLMEEMGYEEVTGNDEEETD